MRRPKAAIGGDNQQAEKNSVVLDQGERLRFLGLTLSSIAEGVMIVDTQGRLVFMNEAAKRLAQKVPSPELPVAQQAAAFKLRYPDGRAIPPEETPLGLAARGCTVIDFVLLLGKPDGSDAYITTSAGPVRDEEANVVGAFVIFRDVTEQVFFEKREEEMAEALRAANERFRQRVRAAEDAARRERTLREKLQAQEKLHARLAAILDATSDYVGTADSEERLLYHNRAALRMLGIREGEDISKLRIRDVHPRWAYDLLQREGIPTAIREGFWTGETEILTRDGREIPVSQVLIAHKKLDGTVEFLSTIMRDISERKRIEEELRKSRDELEMRVKERTYELEHTNEELRESEERFRSLSEATFEGLVIHESGKVAEVNQAFCSMFGYEPSEIIGRTGVDFLVALESRAEMWGRIRAGYEKPYEAIGLRKDGTTFPMEVQGKEIEYRGRPARVAAVRDITERRRAEQFRQEYISLVSHDLRQPLQIIQGQAQILLRALEKTGIQAAHRQSARAIATGAKRMNAMIQDLVESARLEAGQVQLERRPIDLRSFLSDLLARCSGVMDVGRVEVDMPVDLPKVSADPDRLERILMNLLTNALKYSSPETRVLIKARRVDGEVVTSVADRGVGIAPEDLPHIFERFYRAKGIRKAEGLGLGLYITRMLVETQGGRVRVESELGQGSPFYFTLPVAG